MYVSPFARSRAKVWPFALRARRPRPVAVEVPQWEKESWEEMVGVTERLEPVQARRAARWERFQSWVPSSCRTVSVSLGDFGVMRRETGVVEVRRW